LLFSIVQANEQETNKLTDKEVSSNAIGFGIGGNDSTASALTSCLYMLSRHPDVQEKLRDEIDSKLKGSSPTSIRDLEELKYLSCVIKESMRLIPPFSNSFPRIIQSDDTLGTYQVQKGLSVSVNFVEMGRDPELWDKPTEFIPERFENDTVHPGFMVFGFGPRVCVGQRMAMITLKIIVTQLLQEFKIISSNDSDFDNSFGITKPTKPLSIKLEKRNIQ